MLDGEMTKLSNRVAAASLLILSGIVINVGCLPASKEVYQAQTTEGSQVDQSEQNDNGGGEGSEQSGGEGNVSDAGDAGADDDDDDQSDSAALEDDRDEDGVADRVDCDPKDASIRESHIRACTNELGCEGEELCSNGEWAQCNAPANCDCEPDETREVACGFCGTRVDVCKDGTWDLGECINPGECEPGSMRSGDACGFCGVMESSCNDSCEWSDDWECNDAGECVPGDAQEQVEDCGECDGSWTRTRTCTNSCLWPSWGDWGECIDDRICTPNQLDTQRVGCGMCGWEWQYRYCQEGTCDWDPQWHYYSDRKCYDQRSCYPGTTDKQTQPCGPLEDGLETRYRNCRNDCYWTSWGRWSECVGATEPGDDDDDDATSDSAGGDTDGI